MQRFNFTHKKKYKTYIQTRILIFDTFEIYINFSEIQ